MVAKALIVLAVVTFALGNPRTLYGPHVFPATGKIINGTEASEGEIPWQVSIQTAEGSQMCGGSIVNANWIVTAAHCSDINPTYYRVRAGTLTYGSGGSVHEIDKIVVHPDYNSNTFQSDIAVWKVKTPFIWDTHTGNISLPVDNTTISANTSVTVSGWGTTSSGGPVNPVLLKVDVPIVLWDTCNDQYVLFGGINDDEICAGEEGKDSCQGDSGGPLFLHRVLHGIVSWGVGCARPNFAGVYTGVSFYTNWIKNETAN